MKYKWLHKNNNKKLIIFFNGWGMDEIVVEHLNPENYDILMFYDYNSLDSDFDFTLISHFSEVNLVAWSMGVMIATLFDIQYNTKTAINGTLKPIDDKYGIPQKIYSFTIENFSDKSLSKFVSNMFNNTDNIYNINRNYAELKSELIAIKNYKADENFKYNKIIISDKDKIIPTKNQTAFWGIEPNLNSGHAPFICFKKWSELL